MNSCPPFAYYNCVETSTVKTTSAEIHVRIFHPAQNETIIMLHGGPGVPDYLETVAAMLPDFRVITYDQRGSGQSKALQKDYSVTAHLEDLEMVADSHGGNRFHIFGHSWGGALAQLYAAKHPEKLLSLFLCDSAPGFGRDWMVMVREETRMLFEHEGLKGLFGMESKMFSGMFGKKRQKESWTDIMIHIWKNFFTYPEHAPVPSQFYSGISGPAARKTFFSAMRSSPELLRDLYWLKIRTGLLFGGDEFMIKGKMILYDRFPVAERFLVPAAGHVPWLENPKGFKTALEKFYRVNHVPAGEMNILHQ